ncbi:hypothetical protein E2562_018987 [Oryza meyeriana var. granulata]|uniref:Uncharacterized protein n=1 Tax=Oryza meyeriana var. granulata TaxID=110450 RepID=A0A6G1DKU7_9ORYZ|nr:hypothetical protein E2562_018987 [Oryza meyeriana var. granulata]
MVYGWIERDATDTPRNTLAAGVRVHSRFAPCGGAVAGRLAGVSTSAGGSGHLDGDHAAAFAVARRKPD